MCYNSSQGKSSLPLVGKAGRALCATPASPLKDGISVSAFDDDPSRKIIKIIMYPSPGAVDPACRLRRRYAHAPAAALFTGLGAAVDPASRRCRRYADAPAAAFLSVRTAFGLLCILNSGSATPWPSRPSPLGKNAGRVVASLRPASRFSTCDGPAPLIAACEPVSQGGNRQ
jgi:hypothetical protein